MATLESRTMKTYPYDDEAQVENQTKTEPLNEQQRDLAAKHMPLAMALARKFSKHWDWLYDEMESVAMLALVEAAKSYDSSFDVRFSTYAKTGIFGALTNARNKLMQLHRNFASDGTDTDQWTSVRTSSSLSNEEFEGIKRKREEALAQRKGKPTGKTGNRKVVWLKSFYSRTYEY
jgi:DNA-directed RNA polymerase specialized sigma subunit